MNKIEPVDSQSYLQNAETDTTYSFDTSLSKVAAFGAGMFFLGIGVGAYYFNRQGTKVEQKVSSPPPPIDTFSQEEKSSSPVEEPNEEDKAPSLSSVTDEEEAKAYLKACSSLPLEGATNSQIILLSKTIGLTHLSEWLQKVGDVGGLSAAIAGLEEREQAEFSEITQALVLHVESCDLSNWKALCKSSFCGAILSSHQKDYKAILDKAWDSQELSVTTELFGRLYYTGAVKDRQGFLFHAGQGQKQAVIALGVAHQILQGKAKSNKLIDPLIKQKGGVIPRKTLLEHMNALGDRACFYAAGKKVKTYKFLEEAIKDSLGECIRNEAYQPLEDFENPPLISQYLPIALLFPEQVFDLVVAFDGHSKFVDLLFYYANRKEQENYLAVLHGLCKQPFGKIPGHKFIKEDIKKQVLKGFLEGKEEAVGEYLTESLEDTAHLSEEMKEGLRVFFREDLKQPIPPALLQAHS